MSNEFIFFFFNDTATTEIYTLSLHDALPISDRTVANMSDFVTGANEAGFHLTGVNWGRDLPEPNLVADIRNVVDRKSTRLNSSHVRISYAVFCLKKKKRNITLPKTAAINRI